MLVFIKTNFKNVKSWICFYLSKFFTETIEFYTSECVPDILSITSLDSHIILQIFEMKFSRDIFFTELIYFSDRVLYFSGMYYSTRLTNKLEQFK